MKRAAGILLAISSLNSRYGIGTFGHTARRWVDFLGDAGQKYWQILPLGPTSWGDSPYMSFSAFAINPYYIDLELLCEQGLIRPEELDRTWGTDLRYLLSTYIIKYTAVLGIVVAKTGNLTRASVPDEAVFFDPT